MLTIGRILVAGPFLLFPLSLLLEVNEALLWWLSLACPVAGLFQCGVAIMLRQQAHRGSGADYMSLAELVFFTSFMLYFCLGVWLQYLI